MSAAFVITKWDICAPDNSSDDLIKIISEAFSPFFEAGKTGKTMAAISPVSIDLYSNSTEPGKRMRPYDIKSIMISKIRLPSKIR